VKKISLKNVTEADLTTLQRWRNDPVVRAMSRRKEEFSLEATRKWIFEEGREFMIAWQDDCPLGFLSFEKIGEKGSEFEVSIVVATEKRGCGLGKQILELADQFEAGAILHAQVRKENPASISLFKSVGFKEVKNDDQYIYFKKSPILL
jgi:RimJ/RimL family protein N-acetyltransferase